MDHAALDASSRCRVPARCAYKAVTNHVQTDKSATLLMLTLPWLPTGSIRDMKNINLGARLAAAVAAAVVVVVTLLI